MLYRAYPSPALFSYSLRRLDHRLSRRCRDIFTTGQVRYGMRTLHPFKILNYLISIVLQILI